MMRQTHVPVASPPCVVHLIPESLTHGVMCFVSVVQFSPRGAHLHDLAHLNSNLLHNKAVTSSTGTSAFGTALRDFVHFDIIKFGM